MNIVTLLWKNGDHPKRVVDFPQERDTFRNKIMEIVEDFDEKSYNNNGKPWKSSRILRVNPNFFTFLFFHFLNFFIFSFFHFSFCSFFHFFIFLLIFLFHFLSFSFSLLGAQNLIFFGLNFITISLDNSCVKNQFLGPSRVQALLSFFSSFFFSRFFLSFSCFYLFIFCLFLFISSRFDFLMFFIFFFHFSEEKSVFFSCFLYFFQICFVAGISIRV